MLSASGIQPTPLQFPFMAYQTENKMNDYEADDMRYADFSETTLKGFFGLDTITPGIDPYSGEVFHYPGEYHSFLKPLVTSEKRSLKQIADLLFEQFRRYSLPVSFMGNRALFIALINHMKGNSGLPFSHKQLNEAYYQQIVGDKSEESSLLIIKNTLDEYIDWSNRCYPASRQDEFNAELAESILPKFNRWYDRFNGLSMSVHDIYATHISIKSLRVAADNYSASIHFKAQDHFGLDTQDILKLRFHHIPIFRIWFILQRWEKFGYKPFMTNMEAVVDIIGKRTQK
ncbi:DUF3289 family protein [Erwiniaceae bacterium BAC15a-03b]|uniref:DUF3289 family protein n=1 Tax=Winslowiella arboricola TaxID=2978220 RepID=A0A9J6PRQ1_9GAMM|nr:DUF3289 family protein [Winslowiella arboricola]MCU5771892.1 DUF3289 family protein [Winslowiella arboricola]MCU5778325.1 DUF3289 family protein [Winslowiella arboricola]